MSYTFKGESEQMTCKDCIYYKSIGTLCDKYIYPEERNNEPCKHFKNNDGTYHDGSWHCPRCGAIVGSAGLCDECDKAVDSWESVSK